MALTHSRLHRSYPPTARHAPPAPPARASVAPRARVRPTRHRAAQHLVRLDADVVRLDLALDNLRRRVRCVSELVETEGTTDGWRRLWAPSRLGPKLLFDLQDTVAVRSQIQYRRIEVALSTWAVRCRSRTFKLQNERGETTSARPFYPHRQLCSSISAR